MVVVDQSNDKVTYQCRKCGEFRGYDVEYVLETEQQDRGIEILVNGTKIIETKWYPNRSVITFRQNDRQITRFHLMDKYYETILDDTGANIKESYVIELPEETTQTVFNIYTEDNETEVVSAHLKIKEGI